MSRNQGRLGAVSWATPAVIALYFPLALLVANRGEIEPAAAGRAVLLGLGVCALVTLLSWLALRRRETAVTLASLGMIVFFSYGHLYNGLKNLGAVGIAVARHRYLLPLEAAILLGLAVLLVRRPGIAPALAQWLTAVAWILIAFPAATLAIELRTKLATATHVPEPAPSELSAHMEDLPDIYYVVLDGYGRSDILKDSYQFDNTPFLDALRSRGFFVADAAMSNYSRTVLSIASSLNMDHVEPLLERTGDGGSRRLALIDLIHHSRVFTTFRSMGYTTVAFETGYRATEVREADVYLIPNYEDIGQGAVAYAGAGLNRFEGLFLQTTIARVVLDFYMQDIQRAAPGLVNYEYDRHRTRVLFTISSLSDFAGPPEANFVFAHVISPHPPFVFGPRGEKLSHGEVFQLHDRCCQDEDYAGRYAGQIEYLNRALIVEIDEILSGSRGNAIILLQGDHGPAGLLDWSAPSDIAIRDRMAILNAYYLPGSVSESLYPSITPANSFRVILDGYFGKSEGLVEDAAYFHLTLDQAIRVNPSP